MIVIIVGAIGLGLGIISWVSDPHISEPAALLSVISIIIVILGSMLFHVQHVEQKEAPRIIEVSEKEVWAADSAGRETSISWDEATKVEISKIAVVVRSDGNSIKIRSKSFPLFGSISRAIHRICERKGIESGFYKDRQAYVFAIVSLVSSAVTCYLMAVAKWPHPSPHDLETVILSVIGGHLSLPLSIVFGVMCVSKKTGLLLVLRVAVLFAMFFAIIALIAFYAFE